MMPALGKHFTTEEFTCKCGCGYCNPHPLLIDKLDQIREVMGAPLVIASGCRCEAYNKKCGGVDQSAHTMGLAADIATHSSQERFNLLGKILRGFVFKRIGIGKNFIHVDIDETKPGCVLWLYP